MNKFSSAFAKQIFISILFSFSFFLLSYSQKWIDIGAKGGYGLNLLYNDNVLNDRNFTPNLSFGYCFGGKLGLNFNEYHSITLDIISSVFNQSYNYSDTVMNPDSSITRNNYTRSFGFNSLSFLPMYRKMKGSSYVEIGPQYSMVMKTRGRDSLEGEMDVSKNLVKSYYSIVAGFGGFILGTENFGILLGLRLSYTLNDIISKDGQQINFPSVNKYSSYKPSNPFSALMVMEFNYDLGYLASAKCGKKTKFLMF